MWIGINLTQWVVKQTSRQGNIIQLVSPSLFMGGQLFTQTDDWEMEICLLFFPTLMCHRFPEVIKKNILIDELMLVDIPVLS